MFPIWLALLDFVPVVLFGAAIIKTSFAVNDFLFITGAIITTLAGLMKASWKLILAIKQKDIPWLNKSFFKTLMSGFVFMVIGIGRSFKSLDFASVLKLPRVIFLVIAIVLFIFMAIYRKTKFKNKDFKTNLIGEIINSLAMASLVIAAFMK